MPRAIGIEMKLSLVFLIACVAGLFGRVAFAASEITVAGDGSGDYKTVQAAVDAAPAGTGERICGFG